MSHVSLHCEFSQGGFDESKCRASASLNAATGVS